jgi:hypothetical protein
LTQLKAKKIAQASSNNVNALENTKQKENELLGVLQNRDKIGETKQASIIKLKSKYKKAMHRHDTLLNQLNDESDA